ncbi:hypothetical protein RIF29_39251 [Crotalaria pallida]|uniref:B-like cyclin n=1 Tax=Crotalaria pallida TaxID=3830 RepID=A0AAN9E1G6_CROPI
MDSKPEFNPAPPNMETIATNYATESDYMPTQNFYSDPYHLKIRKLAVSVIAKYWTVVDIDAFVPYLAMNYFDKLISQPDPDNLYFLLNIDKLRLVAITCLVMAAKMRKFAVSFYLPDIYEDFKRGAIKRMADQIYIKLKWFMKPVTPLSFLDYFYYRFPTFGVRGGFKRRCINKIIVQAQGDNYFVKYNYKFSDIAFSSLVAASRLADPSVNLCIFKAEPMGLKRCDQKLYELCNEKGMKTEKGSSSNTTMGIKIAAKTETKSHQQRLGREVKETSAKPVAAATESDRRRHAKGKAVVKPEVEKKEESILEEEAPKRLMDFMILWPIDDPFIEKKQHSFEFPPLLQRASESEFVGVDTHPFKSPSSQKTSESGSVVDEEEQQPFEFPSWQKASESGSVVDEEEQPPVEFPSWQKANKSGSVVGEEEQHPFEFRSSQKASESEDVEESKLTFKFPSLHLPSESEDVEESKFTFKFPPLHLSSEREDVEEKFPSLHLPSESEDIEESKFTFKFPSLHWPSESEDVEESKLTFKFPPLHLPSESEDVEESKFTFKFPPLHLSSESDVVQENKFTFKFPSLQ